MFKQHLVEQAVARQAPAVAASTRTGVDILEQVWHTHAHDPQLGDVIAQTPYEGTACWSGTLNTMYPVTRRQGDYAMNAVDGSQIYPDPHTAIPAYAVNIASVRIACGVKGSAAFHTEPYVWLSGSSVTPSYVDAIRLVYEIYHLAQTDSQAYALLDGPLTWWALRDASHMQNALACLEQLRSSGVLCAGYMSMPRFRHIAQALYAAAQIRSDETLSDDVQAVTDVHVMQRVLPVWYRTQMFTSADAVMAWYPAELVPHFCYVHTETEIARIEMPAYVAQSQEKVDAYMAVLRDQIEKGYGYPIALTEAHESAVIREADRQFFFYAVGRYTQVADTSYKQRLKHRPVM